MNFVESFNFYGTEAKEIPCIKGDGAPTAQTEGGVGCFYMDTSTGIVYRCVAVNDGVYVWREESVEVVQKKGNSDTNAMSQKATTEHIRAILEAFDTVGGANLLDPLNAEEGYYTVTDSALVPVSTPSNNRTIKPIAFNSDTCYIATNLSVEADVGDSGVLIYQLNEQGAALKTSNIQISTILGRTGKLSLVAGTTQIHVSINGVTSRGVKLDNICISTSEITEFEPFGGVETPTKLKIELIPTDFIAQKTGNGENIVVSQKAVTNEIERIAVKRNLFTDAELIEGYYSQVGDTSAMATYNYFKDIVLPKGTYRITPRARFVVNWTDKTNVTITTTNPIFTVESESVFRITVYSADSDYKLFSTEYEQSEVESIGMVTLNPNIKIPNINNTDYEYRNMLTGKKWYACGDSFTADGYGTADQPKFTEGIYAGRNKVYPYFIGNRCGIDVYNIASGGKTLAYVEGYNNCFADTQYTTIPEDADYITLYFGINDGHQSVPIGTVDDAVNTTFCGAWNIVLEYLIANHPYAHIGIIVSNGTSEAYATATKQMAVKWGIPYLDFATGDQTPLLLRTLRENVCTKAKDLRLSAFRVSDTNSHPNADCHEYESYSIESWLMRI